MAALQMKHILTHWGRNKVFEVVAETSSLKMDEI